MQNKDIIKMCFDSLKRRKGRTILTVLGVFIGCVSIIIMISIGAGMKESQDQMIANMGDVSVIEVYGGGSTKDGQTAKMDDKAVEAFKEIEGVEAVMPRLNVNDYNITADAGINGRYYTYWTEVVGLATADMEDFGYRLSDGDYPKKGEALAGQYFAYNFYDSIMPEGHNYVDRWVWDEATQSYNTDNVPDPFFDPMKTDITLYFKSYDDQTETKGYAWPLKISGLTVEDYGKGYETSQSVMMDIEDLRTLLNELNKTSNTKFDYSGINVKATSLEEVTSVEEAIKDMGYNTYSMQSYIEELNKQTRQIELMLGGLGAISLFVAAIGITNTMTMSVTERTKEIGVMKALGCYVKDIRKMFLMEAGAIGFLGGVLGLLFSFIVSIVLNIIYMKNYSGGGDFKTLLWQAIVGGENVSRLSVITPGLMLFAITFAIFVGVASGYIPANKAVKIPAIEAIRNE